MATQTSPSADRSPTAGITALALAKSVRVNQLKLRTELLQKVAAGWPALNFDHLDRTWPGWLDAMQSVLADYHQQMAAESSTLYRGTRQLEVGEPGPTVLTPPPTEEWTKKALGYSAPGVFEKELRARTDRKLAEQRALTTTLGTSSRIALDGARQTLVDAGAGDGRQVRYFRVTDGDPCYFCALQASRGAVYRTAFAAGEDNTFHDHCACTVGVTFVGGHQLDGPAAEAARIYAEQSHLSGQERVKAFRRAWEARERPAAAPARAA